MDLPERTAEEWFEEAARWYVEYHQGCPWCGGANRLYRSQRIRVTEYHCGSCDFFACHDPIQDRYYMAPGDTSRASDTMLANQVLNVH